MTPGSGRPATYLVTACTACFAVHFFQRGVMFWGRIFLGPIGQEAKTKTLIFSGLAITAGHL